MIFNCLDVSSLQSQFNSQFPAAHYLDADHLDALEPLLKSHALLAPDEVVTGTEKPGEGNMNFVLRVITDRQTLILKQSRPWVEKYPQIAAPNERLHAEATYYRATATEPRLRAMSPALLAVDSIHLVMITEDLGAGSDYTSIYSKGTELPLTEIKSLFGYLARLHQSTHDADPSKFPLNRELKQLNHEHIFNYPFRAGFDLDAIQPGLQALAAPIQANDSLRNRLSELGEVYLDSGPVLIHGARSVGRGYLEE